MDRRGFLTAMFAAAVAPAICKADNLMKIAVPAEKKIILGRGMTRQIVHVDEFCYKNVFASDFDGDTLNFIFTKDPAGRILFNRSPTLNRDYGKMILPEFHQIATKSQGEFDFFRDIFKKAAGDRRDAKRTLITLRS